jgi:peptidoglycan/LPS O-acetylase OafA/YrhL
MKHQAHIDAIRGLAALWVFVFHASALVGYKSALIPPGGFAVDIFMFISGLLMTGNFLLREKIEPLHSPATIVKFLVRRFFRIAPLYYPLLLIAFFLWDDFAKYSAEAMALFPPPWASSLQIDPTERIPSPLNLGLHVSFLFGLFPQFASNNALPDWSLSLEMQFYLAIPFILLLTMRYGLAAVLASCVVLQILMRCFVGLYRTPTAFGLWPQPSFLPFKIVCFMTGVAAAIYLFRRDMPSLMLAFVSLVFSDSPLFSAVVVFCIIVMMDPIDMPASSVVLYIKNKLSGRLSEILGDISYAVYLLHMLILLPLFHYLASFPAFTGAVPLARFTIIFLIASAIVVPLSWVAHVLIERNGIAIGRVLTSKLTRPTTVSALP